MEPLAVIGAQLAEGTPAQAQRPLQHRVEDRREIAGRGIDDLQYLGSRGLLLQGLARLGQEPRILHCDDRLRGESFEQRDFLVGKGPHFLPVDREYAEQLSVFEQRHSNSAPSAAKVDKCARLWIAGPVVLSRS